MLIELLTKRYPGMRAWLMQRLTALLLAIYSVMALVRFLLLQPNGYEAWVDFFQPCWWRFASWLFWVSLSIHAWLGVRDVFKDYVPNAHVRSVLLKLLVVMLWLYWAWATWLLLV
ncbi:MAG: succinate dehydrogenase, hydrophobic membrane anchor protein [Methylotenera sp.]|nr:succinate dehydrogenase, hydrophobic membrane anchor protein [Methylotenera sp.]MSQ00116.1 succinate dehydrogenase, hydrophobic membrane anchor protein [Methylotenera sp.]